MATFKQDMPPPGGFSPINYKRIPLKGPWPLTLRWLPLFGVMGLGWYGYHLDKKRIMYETVEKRAATFSILPLLMAEKDRALLKHFAKLRKEEEELMKDVEGWEVGKYYGEPIYKTLKPNEWYEPHRMETWIYSDLSHERYVRNILKRL